MWRCVCACVRVCVCMCMYVCMCVCDAQDTSNRMHKLHNSTPHLHWQVRKHVPPHSSCWKAMYLPEGGHVGTPLPT